MAGVSPLIGSVLVERRRSSICSPFRKRRLEASILWKTAHAPFCSNGSSPASAYTYSACRSSFFNFNQFSSSFPEQENYGGFVNFSHKLFGDQMVLFGDMFYENTHSHGELAPGATGNFTT